MKSHYSVKRLIDVAPLVNRRVKPFDGKLQYLATGDVDGDAITSSTSVTYTNRPSRADLFIENGDVAYARMKETIKVLQGLNGNADRYIISTGFAVHSPNPQILDSKYLKRFCLTDYFQKVKDKLCSGATQKAITNDGIAKLKIPIPYFENQEKSLAEQRRIAAILDKADDVHKKRAQSLRLADEFLKSTFLEMFGEWLKAPISEMSKLGDPELANIVSGVTKGRRFNGNQTVIVPYIRVANVQDGFLDLSEIKTIEALPSDVESLSLQHGDVLMTEGGDFDKLGRGAMWETNIPDCIHQNHVFRIRCNKNTLLPEYFSAYIQTGLAKAYFLRCAKKTSNLASINMTQLRATPVPCPPITLQRRYAHIRKVQRDMIASGDYALTYSNNLFNSLVQRAFGGE